MRRSTLDRMKILGLPSEEETEKKIKAAEEAAIDRFDFKKIPSTGLKTATTDNRFWVATDFQGHELWLEAVTIGPDFKNKDQHYALDADNSVIRKNAKNEDFKATDFKLEKRSDKRLEAGIQSLTYKAIAGCAEQIKRLHALAVDDADLHLLQRDVRSLLYRFISLVVSLDDAGEYPELERLARSQGWNIDTVTRQADEVMERSTTAEFFASIPETGIEARKTPYRLWVNKDTFWREVGWLAPDPTEKGSFLTKTPDGEQLLESSLPKSQFYRESRDEDRLEVGKSSFTFRALRSYVREIHRLSQQIRRLRNPDQIEENQERIDQVRNEIQSLVSDLWHNNEESRLVDLINQSGWDTYAKNIVNEELNLASDRHPKP